MMERKVYLIFTWQPQEAESTRCVCSDKSSWKWLVDQSFSSKDIDLEEGGGSIAQFLVYLLLDPTARGFIPSKKNFRGKNY